MEFRIQKNEFLRGLRLAQGIADRKSTMPILANVLLRTDGKSKLVMAATDLNVSVSAELAAKIDKEGGITVSARHLHEIIASLPGEDVVFRRAENHWADIKAGKVEYKLVGMPDRRGSTMPWPASLQSPSPVSFSGETARSRQSRQKSMPRFRGCRQTFAVVRQARQARRGRIVSGTPAA